MKTNISHPVLCDIPGKGISGTHEWVYIRNGIYRCPKCGGKITKVDLKTATEGENNA